MEAVTNALADPGKAALFDALVGDTWNAVKTRLLKCSVFLWKSATQDWHGVLMAAGSHFQPALTSTDVDVLMFQVNRLLGFGGCCAS